LAQAAFFRELDEQPDRLAGDPVLGVVEIDVLGLDDEALATVAVLREQVAQVKVANLVGMPRKRLPDVEPAERVDSCRQRLCVSLLGGRKHVTPAGDAVEQLGPRGTEGGRALLLQPERERLEVDARLREPVERLVDVSAVVG
jgi:hypothetical protein